MAYEDTYIAAHERRHSVQILVLIAAYTLITGIALSSFLVALYYSLRHDQTWFVGGTLGGTVVIFLLYYRGLETIFSEFHERGPRSLRGD